MTADGYPFAFTCQRSGNCCARPQGVVRLADGDIERLGAELSMPAAAVRSRFVEPGGGRLRTAAGGRCVFLRSGEVAACEVYRARPQQCRSWPFWPSMREVDVATRAARFCPGLTVIEDVDRS